MYKFDIQSMSSFEHQFASYQSYCRMPKVSSCSRTRIRQFNYHIVPFRYRSVFHNVPLNRHNVCTNFDKLTRCYGQIRPAISINSEYGNRKTQEIQEETNEKSFWGAVSLIIGTAVGPGMLGLPAATIKSGPVPSTVAIILSWIYVISSILLVAELSFAVMEEDNLAELEL